MEKNEKPLLTLTEFYKEVTEKKTKKKQLIDFLSNLNKKYTIPINEQIDTEKCPPEYPESYIVNESKFRFKNEIKQSHFLAHWRDLCKYPEITGKLRFIYNLINLKKELLVLLLNNTTSKLFSSNIILENSSTLNSSDRLYFDKIINFLGLSHNDISRIKIDNQTSKTLKLKNTKTKTKPTTHILPSNDISVKSDNETKPTIIDLNFDNSNNNNNDFKIDLVSNSRYNTLISNPQKYNYKMAISFSMIINLEEEYPRNLLSCPIDKVVIGERHKNLKKRTLNFLCHKDNMIERLKTNKLCLSIWLIKSQKKQKWTTSLKMGTAYLSDTFPGEKGTINDFIKEILNISSSQESAIFLNKIEEGIKNNYFYAIESNEPIIKNPKNPKKNKKEKEIRKKTKKKFLK